MDVNENEESRNEEEGGRRGSGGAESHTRHTPVLLLLRLRLQFDWQLHKNKYKTQVVSSMQVLVVLGVR